MVLPREPGWSPEPRYHCPLLSSGYPQWATRRSKPPIRPPEQTGEPQLSGSLQTGPLVSCEIAFPVVAQPLPWDQLPVVLVHVCELTLMDMKRRPGDGRRQPFVLRIDKRCPTYRLAPTPTTRRPPRNFSSCPSWADNFLDTTRRRSYGSRIRNWFLSVNQDEKEEPCGPTDDYATNRWPD